jgi:hypothetical protein
LLGGELCDETIAIGLDAPLHFVFDALGKKPGVSIKGTITVVAIPALSMIGSACSIVPSQGPGNFINFMNALAAVADG